MIYDSKNIVYLKDVPILVDGQIYIYCVLNYPQGNIKIGQTTNIVQRIKSLSGSNGGGNKITHLYLSPATYLKSMEHALHDYYNKYRIKGTEWFKGEYLDFYEVANHIESLFYSKGYETCNRVRKEFVEKERKEKLRQEEKKEKLESPEKGKKRKY